MGVGFTDLHIHLLPGLDDGPVDTRQSLLMLEELGRLGYIRVVATPHRIAGLYEASAPAVEDALELVYGAAEKSGIDSPHLSAARECHFDRLLLEDMMQDKVVTLSDATKAFLFELPFGDVPANIDQFLFQAGLKGYRPVMAHPERNRELACNFEMLESLQLKGACFLINLGSLVGKYGRQAKKAARWMIDNDLATAAATDAHGVDDVSVIASQAIREIRRRWGEAKIQRLLVQGPKALLELPGG